LSTRQRKPPERAKELRLKTRELTRRDRGAAGRECRESCRASTPASTRTAEAARPSPEARRTWRGAGHQKHKTQETQESLTFRQSQRLREPYERKKKKKKNDTPEKTSALDGAGQQHVRLANVLHHNLGIGLARHPIARRVVAKQTGRRRNVVVPSAPTRMRREGWRKEQE